MFNMNLQGIYNKFTEILRIIAKKCAYFEIDKEKTVKKQAEIEDFICQDSLPIFGFSHFLRFSSFFTYCTVLRSTVHSTVLYYVVQYKKNSAAGDR